MYLKFHTPERISQRYKKAIEALINNNVFDDEADALKCLKIDKNKFHRDTWRPSKKNVRILVKLFQVNALWLYTSEKIEMINQTKTLQN